MPLPAYPNSVFDERSWGSDAFGFQNAVYQISPGFTSYGALSGVSDVDYYQVGLLAGGTYSLSMSGNASLYGWSTGRSISFPVFSIVDNAGNVLLTSGASGVMEAGIAFTANQSGFYHVRVSGLDNLASGDYAIALTMTGTAPPPVLSRSVASTAAATASKAEGNAGPTAFTFTITLDVASAETQSLEWRAVSSGLSPAGAGDFAIGALPSGTLTFAPGQTSKTITVAVAGDTSLEPDEGFAVELLSPSAGLVIGTAAATATILNDDVETAPKVSIAAIDPAQVEGNVGSTAFSFTVSLDAAPSTAQSASWRVSGFRTTSAGASDASDFAGGTLPSGTLTFAPGETSKTITVSLAGDTNVEADEGFMLELVSASAGLALGVASASALGLNDDLMVVPGTGGADAFFLGKSFDGVWTPGKYLLDGVLMPSRYIYDGLGGRDALDLGSAGLRHADIAAQADGSMAVTHGEDTAVLRSIEEVRFVDGRLVFDADDAAARAVRLYEAALDRPPDQGGLNFWIGAVQAGQPLSGLAASFLASPEFQSRFGGTGTTNGAFVDQLYLNVLGRAGEAGGRDFWVNSLDGGTGRADVLVAFSESPENKAGTAALVRAGIWDRSEAAAEVARLYDTVLGRLPDAPGLAVWKDMRESGEVSLAQMADGFTASAEFQAKYGALGNRAFADALYVNTLDRAADQAGLDFWTGELDAGVARSAVVLAFSESAEHVALTAANIQSETRAEFGILFA